MTYKINIGQATPKIQLLNIVVTIFDLVRDLWPINYGVFSIIYPEQMFHLIKTIFRYIYGYSTASTDDAAYIIGGADIYNTIAEYRNNQWRNLGSLTKGRFYHGSITIGQETMIIGGYTSDSS